MEENEEQKPKREVVTKIKCPKCDHEYEISVEVPTDPETPKMGYQG